MRTRLYKHIHCNTVCTVEHCAPNDGYAQDTSNIAFFISSRKSYPWFRAQPFRKLPTCKQSHHVTSHKLTSVCYWTSSNLTQWLSTLQMVSWEHIHFKFQEWRVTLHFFPHFFEDKKILKLVLLEWPACSLIHTIWQQDNECKSSSEETTIPYKMDWWCINSHFGLILVMASLVLHTQNLELEHSPM